MLAGKHIAILVTGSVAAYKIPLLVRALVKKGAAVHVAITRAAETFVTKQTLEIVSGYAVLSEDTDAYPEAIPHIALAQWADFAVVAPASANSLGKMANGIADNPLLATFFALDVPVLIAPAMNDKMWASPAVQRNVQQLKADGYHVLAPAAGPLAEGHSGRGRMPEVDVLAAATEALVALSEMAPTLSLAGETVAISLGGTAEPLDPVRVLTNRSSGKMGLALAYVAALAGATVHIVLTASARTLPLLAEFHAHSVDTAADLFDTMRALNDTADTIIMAAAVGDYRPVAVSAQKMKKQTVSPSGTMTLELVENPDILKALDRNESFLVGFAAETEQLEHYARQKLRAKDVDLIVANDVSDCSIGFGSDDNAVLLITEQDSTPVAKASKYHIAAVVWQKITAMKRERAN